MAYQIVAGFLAMSFGSLGHSSGHENGMDMYARVSCVLAGRLVDRSEPKLCVCLCVCVCVCYFTTFPIIIS